MIIGIDMDGRKSVLSLEIGENESSKYWLGVLNGLKARGVKDVMIISLMVYPDSVRRSRLLFPRQNISAAQFIRYEIH